MLTKEMFCKKIICDFTGRDTLPNAGELDNCVVQSSRLAVALEFLGLIKDPQMARYTQSRGGIENITYDKDKEETYILTTREMISLLPEVIE